LDGGPKVGKGSPALARQVSGLPVSNAIDLKSRYDGQVRCPDVLRVSFGGPAGPFDHQNEAEGASIAKAAFDVAGGAALGRVPGNVVEHSYKILESDERAKRVPPRFLSDHCAISIQFQL
jgi:hypothetical protein